MKTTNRAIISVALCLFVAAFAGTVFADGADAANVHFGNSATYSGFTDMDNGTFTVYVSNDSTTTPMDIKVVIKDLSENELASTTATVPAETENQAVSLSFGYGSSGIKYVKVYLYDNTDPNTPSILNVDGPFEIDVSHSIWKDWVTYVIVVVIIIAILLIAYFYFRGAPERAAKKEAKALESAKGKKAAEKTKYDGNRKSKRK
ncbi:MAG: hypothetical protein ACI4Q9_00525 [Candidatus Methanomethylophilaceae archaeon]